MNLESGLPYHFGAMNVTVDFLVLEQFQMDFIENHQIVQADESNYFVVGSITKSHNMAFTDIYNIAMQYARFTNPQKYKDLLAEFCEAAIQRLNLAEIEGASKEEEEEKAPCGEFSQQFKKEVAIKLQEHLLLEENQIIQKCQLFYSKLITISPFFNAICSR